MVAAVLSARTCGQCADHNTILIAWSRVRVWRLIWSAYFQRLQKHPVLCQ